MKTEEKDLIVVGIVSGAHGVRGEVRVQSFTDDPETLFTFGSLYRRNGTPLLTAQSWRAGKKGFIVRPEEHQEKEYWDGLRGTELCIPRSALPDADEDEFYFEDLIGLQAVSPDGQSLGEVKAVLNHGAGDLLEIRPPEGAADILIPFTEQDVPEIDLDRKQLVIADIALWTRSGND